MKSEIVQKINRQKGSRIFLLGLALAIVLGGAVRLLFSPAVVGQALRKQMQKTDAIQVEFSQARLTLSSGMFPRFGLILESVEFTSHHDRCRFPWIFTAENFYVPLDLLSLFRGEIRAGVLSAPQANLSKDSLCEKIKTVQKKKESSVEKKKLPDIDIKKTAPRTLSDFRFPDKEWARALFKASEFANGLRLKNLSVQPGPGTQSEIVLVDFKLRLDRQRRDLSLTTDVILSSDLTGLSSVPKIEAKLQAAEKSLTFEASAQHREGLAEIFGQFIFSSGQMQLDAKVRDFPALEIVGLTKHFKLLQEDLEPRLLWLSCSGQFNGRITDLDRRFLEVSDCRLHGEVGEARIDQALIGFDPQIHLEPFVIIFEDLKLVNVLQALRRQGPSGVVSEFGRINARLNVHSAAKMEVQGALTDLKLSFSNRGVRGHQKVEELIFRLAYEDGRVSGLLDRARLNQGEFKGQLSANLSRDFREGLVQVQVDKIQFHPSVQRLMTGGELEPISIYGRARLENGELVTWEGDFGSSAVKGDGWVVKGIKVNSNFKGEDFSSQVRIASIDLNKSNSYFESLKPLIVAPASDSLHLENLSSQLRLTRRSAMWDEMKFELSGGASKGSSSGMWVFGQNVKGLITRSGPGKQSNAWSVTGPTTSPRIEPADRAN